MKTRNNTKLLIPAALALAAFILDHKTAIQGAHAGVEVCINTVLPSLFPFIFLSSALSSSLLSQSFKGSRMICKLYRIPLGSEGIILSGLLGGYPVGAKSIGEAVTKGHLSPEDASRMLVFCNAAGPAFLFGIVSVIFSQRWIPWCLWGIHLFSGFFMAQVLPVKNSGKIRLSTCSDQSLAMHLRCSVQAMGDICGWIILMRTLISFVEKWGLRYLPFPLPNLITGLLELANGCIHLPEVENTGLRFVLCSSILGFGGLCIALQTSSVASAVNQKMYLPGKCIQAAVSFLVAYAVQSLFLANEQKIHIQTLPVILLAAVIGIVVYSRVKQKKVVEIY